MVPPEIPRFLPASEPPIGRPAAAGPAPAAAPRSRSTRRRAGVDHLGLEVGPEMGMGKPSKNYGKTMRKWEIIGRPLKNNGEMEVYPLVMTNITMENQRFSWENSLCLFVIFNSYVKLQEGSKVLT